MKNLNLKEATIRDLENFFLGALSEDINTITCKTGEIGLLLFHRLVEDINKYYYLFVNLDYVISGKSLFIRLPNGRSLTLKIV